MFEQLEPRSLYFETSDKTSDNVAHLEPIPLQCKDNMVCGATCRDQRIYNASAI